MDLYARRVGRSEVIGTPAELAIGGRSQCRANATQLPAVRIRHLGMDRLLWTLAQLECRDAAWDACAHRPEAAARHLAKAVAFLEEVHRCRLVQGTAAIRRDDPSEAE